MKRDTILLIGGGLAAYYFLFVRPAQAVGEAGAGASGAASGLVQGGENALADFLANLSKGAQNVFNIFNTTGGGAVGGPGAGGNVNTNLFKSAPLATTAGIEKFVSSYQSAATAGTLTGPQALFASTFTAPAGFSAAQSNLLTSGLQKAIGISPPGIRAVANTNLSPAQQYAVNAWAGVPLSSKTTSTSATAAQALFKSTWKK